MSGFAPRHLPTGSRYAQAVTDVYYDLGDYSRPLRPRSAWIFWLVLKEYICESPWQLSRRR